MVPIVTPIVPIITPMVPIVTPIVPIVTPMVPIVTPIVPRSKSHWYQLVTCSAFNPMKPIFTLGPASGVQNRVSKNLGPTVGP